MKRKRHTPEQIVRKLREGDRLLNEGKDLTEVLRHLEVSESSGARWRAQYGGMKADEAKRLKELERENARLEEARRGSRAGEGDAQGAGRGKLLTPERRRRAVCRLQDRFGVSERLACRVAGSAPVDATQARAPLPDRRRTVAGPAPCDRTAHRRWGYKMADTGRAPGRLAR